MEHEKTLFKGFAVCKEEKYAILGRMLNNIESEKGKEEFKRRIEAVIN
ncbi:hypothetical protein V7146_21325 [Gottfriedia acidiceleris]